MGKAPQTQQGPGRWGLFLRLLVVVGIVYLAVYLGTIMKRRTWEAVATFVRDFAGAADYQALVGSRKPGDFLRPGGAAVVSCCRKVTIRASWRPPGV